MLFSLPFSFFQLLWFATYILGPTPEDSFVDYPVQLGPGLVAWHKVNNDNSDVEF